MELKLWLINDILKFVLVVNYANEFSIFFFVTGAINAVTIIDCMSIVYLGRPTMNVEFDSALCAM